MPHLHFKIEALENAPYRVMNVLSNLRIRQARDVNFAHLRQVDRAGAVHRDLGVEVNLSPDANEQLIAGAQDVVRSDIYIAQGGKGRRYLAKETVSIDRKHPAH